MGKLPWFPFYVDRFHASRKVRGMTAEQVGIYLLLMTEEWSQGPIPDDDIELADIGRAPSQTVRSVLAKCFYQSRTGKQGRCPQSSGSKRCRKPLEQRNKWRPHSNRIR